VKYLADTDIIIKHLRGKHRLSEAKVAAGMAVSIITVGELLYGAHKSVQPQKSLQTVNNFLTDLSIKVLNLNQEIVNDYAKTKAQLEREGQRLDEFDLLIASTAKIHSLTLLTDNLKHFQRIPGIKIA